MNSKDLLMPSVQNYNKNAIVLRKKREQKSSLAFHGKEI